MPIILNSENFSGNSQSIIETQKGYFLNGQYYTKDYSPMPLKFYNSSTLFKNSTLNKIMSNNNGLNYANRNFISLNQQHILIDNIDQNVSYIAVRKDIGFQILKVKEENNNINIIFTTAFIHTANGADIGTTDQYSWAEFGGYIRQDKDNIYFCETVFGYSNRSTFKILKMDKISGIVSDVYELKIANNSTYGAHLDSGYLFCNSSTSYNISKVNENGSHSILNTFTNALYFNLHPSFETNQDGTKTIYLAKSDKTMYRLDISNIDAITTTTLTIESPKGIALRTAAVTLQAIRFTRLNKGAKKYLIQTIFQTTKTNDKGYIQTFEIKENNTLSLISELEIPVCANGSITGYDNETIYFNASGTLVTMCKFNELTESYEIVSNIAQNFDVFGITLDGSVIIDNTNGPLEKFNDSEISKVDIVFEKENYNYKNADINTDLKVSCYNFYKQPKNGNLKLIIEGNAVFENETKEIDLIVNVPTLSVPLRIFGPGNITIVPKIKL